MLHKQLYSCTAKKYLERLLLLSIWIHDEILLMIENRNFHPFQSVIIYFYLLNGKFKESQTKNLPENLTDQELVYLAKLHKLNSVKFHAEIIENNKFDRRSLLKRMAMKYLN